MVVHQAPHHESVVVVGGGLAGLYAAIESARAGSAVTLLERSSHLGGRGRSEERDGFTINLGPHALFARSLGLLREAGIEPPGRSPSGPALGLYGGRTHKFPAGPGSLLTTSLLGPLEKVRLVRLLATLGRVDASSVESMTAAEWVNSIAPSRRLNDLMRSLIRVGTYTNAAEELPADAVVLQLQNALKGVTYVDGGWQSLVDLAAARARGLGVDIRTGVRVEAVAPGEAGPRVLLSGGEHISASSVIVAGSPRGAVELLGEGAGASLRRWAERAVPVHAASLDLGLSALPRPKTIVAFGVDAPHYYSVQSATARLAPEGQALASLGAYEAPGTAPDPERVRHELERLMDSLQPGWRKNLVVERFRPSLTVHSALLRHADGGLRGRPRADAAGVPGVFLAGDWVGPDGMLLDAALLSAREAARQAVATAASRPEAVAVG